MDSSWIPDWLGTAWVLAYVLVLLSHARHAWLMDGEERWWHVGHVLMCLGMIDMYWPTSMLLGERPGVVVFAALAVGALVAALAERSRRGNWRIWLVSGVDMVAMTYMFATMSHRVLALTWLFVAWNLLTVALWTSGRALRLLHVHTAVASQRPREDRLDLRITLTIMALGMAYMFVAMQYGMAGSMGHMDQPMHHMSGM